MTEIRVISILHFVVAALWLGLTIAAVISIGSEVESSSDPQERETLVLFQNAALWTGVLFVVLYTAGGVGTLLGHWWGRVLLFVSLPWTILAIPILGFALAIATLVVLCRDDHDLFFDGTPKSDAVDVPA